MPTFLEGFVHPALAWGAALAAVPLLIHLLNRQRHKPMQWAAMQFVVAAYKRTRRRAQIENLILLLLRMAAVALLAWAIARPFTGEDSPLAPLTESRRDLVLVIDGSASTGYRESVQSVYEATLDRAREILRTFDGTRGDRVRLVHGAAFPRLLSARSPEEALSLLSTLTTPTDERLDLVAVLADVIDSAEEEAAGGEKSNIEVRLLTDLQRGTFLPVATSPEETGTEEAGDAPPLTRALDRLAELGVRVVVEDLGAAAIMPPNLGIESIAPLSEILGPSLPAEIGVRVRNFGPAGRAAVRVSLEVDGERQPSQKVDIDARAAAEVSFPVLFRESGYHSLVARLEGDRLALDDERASVLYVPPAVRVLLVNGDPNDEIDRDEVGYLRAVLEPPDDGSIGLSVMGAYAPFAANTVNVGAFGGEALDLQSYDVILLANVSTLAPKMVERLERFVAGGGTLICTLGDRVADSSAIEGLNSRLWRADGTGLLPARLIHAVEVASRRDAYYRAYSFQEDHPALSFFADERWRPYLTEVPIYAFVTSKPLEDAHVLARLDDADKSPLLVERAYDRGRVLLWTTSIDGDWNRIPESPSTLIPLVHELLRYAGRTSEPPRNTAVGTPVALEVDAFPRNPTVLRPDGSRRPLDGEPVEVVEGVWRLPAITPVDAGGLWKLELEGAATLAFAVQPDSAEGDLERVAPSELEASHSVWRALDPGADGEAGDDDSRPERGELWRPLAALALAALVLETLWAAWIGRGRRLA